MEGLYTLLREILRNQKKIIKEQKKQTKILQAIESSKEQEKVWTSPISKKTLIGIGKKFN